MPESQFDSGKRIAVIGAGISGMSAAWELSGAGLPVDIYEKESTPGGLAGWFETGGTTLEKFYHHIYNKDTDLIDLVGELGLSHHLVSRSTNTGCFYVNKIYRLSSPIDLLRYKPLSFLDRLRLGSLALRARMVKEWKSLDDVSARDWIIRYAGNNVYRVLWEPLFRSKFGRYASEVSAAWLWSKLVQRGGSRSKTGSEELVYFQGGYGVLFKALEDQLKARGVRFFYQSRVTRILSHAGQVSGLDLAGTRQPYDAMIATTQLPDFLNIATDLPDRDRSALQSVGFLGNVCLILELNHRLSDTYWLNVTDPDCPFVGVIEQTNLLDESHYDGHHMAYISRYMDVEDPLYSMNAKQLLQVYMPYLQKIFPEFEDAWIEKIHLWREPHSQAIVSVGFSKKIPPASTSIRGLYLSTMAQIFPEDRQMSNGVKLARRTARCLIKDLKGS